MATITITVEVAETALTALETWLDDIDAGVEEEDKEYIDAIDTAYRAIRLAVAETEAPNRVTTTNIIRQKGL